MKQEVININDLKNIVPFFKSALGDKVLKGLFWLTGIEKVNTAYRNSCPKVGIEFVTQLLHELGVTYRVKEKEFLSHLPQKGFITVSNHPYGGLDGIILIHLLASLRADYKVMVNWILGYIEAMSPHFICVHPVAAASNNRSLGGLKQAKEHLVNGHPMGFFPSGAVSGLEGLHIRDREWQPTVLKLVKNAGLPVVPVYFHGHNSLLFHLLGLIHWRVRSLRLPREVFNKRGKVIDVSIGETITLEEQDRYVNLKEYGSFLKQKTYCLGKTK